MPMDFRYNLSKSALFSLQTLEFQPGTSPWDISLNGILKLNEVCATMYISLWELFSGAFPIIIVFMQFSTKIDWFRTK